MLSVDSVQGYDTASMGKQSVVLRKNVMPCSLGVKRETGFL
jgi:hypothetical protein